MILYQINEELISTFLIAIRLDYQLENFVYHIT